jgi:hypothetical protein
MVRAEVSVTYYTIVNRTAGGPKLSKICSVAGSR